jgi:hypothetical protein
MLLGTYREGEAGFIKLISQELTAYIPNGFLPEIHSTLMISSLDLEEKIFGWVLI